MYTDPLEPSLITAIRSAGWQAKYSGVLAGRNRHVVSATGDGPKRMWQSTVDNNRTTLPPTGAGVAVEVDPTANFCVVPGRITGNDPSSYSFDK
jgi:hypothetical protein